MDVAADDAALTVLARLSLAMNRRDLAAFVACFAHDYASEQPAHPHRRFRGATQVERNWAAMFAKAAGLPGGGAADRRRWGQRVGGVAVDRHARGWLAPGRVRRLHLRRP